MGNFALLVKRISRLSSEQEFEVGFLGGVLMNFHYYWTNVADVMMRADDPDAHGFAAIPNGGGCTVCGADHEFLVTPRKRIDGPYVRKAIEIYCGTCLLVVLNLNELPTKADAPPFVPGECYRTTFTDL